MNTSKRASDKVQTIVIDDDDVVAMGESKDLSHKAAPKGHSPTQQRLFAGSKPSMASSTTDSTQPRISKTSADLAPRRSPSHNGSVFRNPNWGSDTTQRRGLNQAHLSQCSPGSIGSSRSFALSPSPTSFTPTNNLGSVHEPIELDEDDNPCVPECPLPASEQASDFGGASDFCLPLPNQEFESQEGFSDSDDEEDIIDLSGSVRQNKMRRFSVADSDVIELEGWAELKDTIPDGMEVICLEDVYQEDSKSQSKHRASKSAKFERRNPSIVAPYNVHESFLYQKTELRRNKTVELQNGEFLRIKDIIQNSRTNEVKLRGHRLQRTRYLNGLLESKINEVVLFLEVDLDDPRDPLEQGAVEIPVVEVKRLRQARFTNQKFPDCRNMELSDFRGNLDAAEFGGLTVRWKYTCKYETAANRYHNIFKERILERIKPEECLPRYALPDEQRRKHWRGETILGGSYRPMVDREAGHALPTEEDLIERLRELGARKRKYSVGSGEVNALAPTPKRVRYGEKEVEDTRKRLSNVHLGDSNQQEPAMIDLCLSDSDIDELPLSQASSKQTPKPPTPSRLPIIDLSDFPLSEPSPKLDVPPRPRNPIYRTANQTFTYGDAFCGAGGSTRGALLAGLRPKWGFDFFVHAAASWRANFPLGSCFNLDAHSFITSIKSSPAYHEAFKVDILHLSPPCQYFSPAHTIEGVDDEQNVASLFAVLECIKVARPRVVTLEQTFGIMCSRFRWFFNSLINMFTSQDFSVRWAVVPLVHWGLPQRRNRLIIIASCPGEILPHLPLHTHSDTDPSLPPLVSASSVISSIPDGAPNHDPDSHSLQFDSSRRQNPWDGSKILPRAMTTSGGQNYHPSGKRDLTLREYACLQGFPLDHVFSGKHVKKQIGNAVPPCIAKVLFESIRKDLERADGVVDGVEVID